MGFRDIFMHFFKVRVFIFVSFLFLCLFATLFSIVVHAIIKS